MVARPDTAGRLSTMRRELWKRVTAMVTVIVFSVQIRPMESFLTAYLTGPRVHVSLDEVSNVLTPININVAVFGSLIVIVFSDYLRYKPVMIFCGLMGTLAYVCLIVSSYIIYLKIFEIGLSVLTCAEPTFFGYLFAMIEDKDQYQIATGCVTAGMMSGMAVSGLLGQIVVYLNYSNYSPLLYYSLAGVTFATVWMILLPSAKRENDVVAATKAKVFSREAILSHTIPKYNAESYFSQNIKTTPVVTNLFKRIYEDVKQSYTNHTVLRWSFWHVLGMTSNVQITLYINILYTYVADESNDKNMLLNGLVNSLATISAAICAYKIGKVDMDWTRYGDTFLAFGSLALGLSMSLCYFSKNIIIVYLMYICYYAIVQSVFVIVISQIGKQVKNDCYALVLGFNIFLGIVLSMLVSTMMTSLGTSIPGHFLVYGGTYLAVAIFYGCVACFNTYIRTRHFYYYLP